MSCSVGKGGEHLGTMGDQPVLRSRPLNDSMLTVATLTCIVLLRNIQNKRKLSRRIRRVEQRHAHQQDIFCKSADSTATPGDKLSGRT